MNLAEIIANVIFAALAKWEHELLFEYGPFDPHPSDVMCGGHRWQVRDTMMRVR
jgi:hypothetical protein